MPFRFPKLLLATVLAMAAAVTPATAGHATPAADPHRVIAFYQTQFVAGSQGKVYVSPLKLKGKATHIEVAALHLNDGGKVTLNDDPPSDAKYDQMWKDLAKLRQGPDAAKVIMLLGGAAQGTYKRLHEDFDLYYGALRDVLRAYDLDGVDIDIEEEFSLADTQKLIRTLRADFGPDFLITLVPVASDLSGKTKFSGGFDYRKLEETTGADIDWYIGQFYCGWGTLASSTDYQAVINNGFKPSRVVAGTVTNPANCAGYVAIPNLVPVLKKLVGQYSDFGGVAGWEYFNAVGETGKGPESWYAAVREAMN
ncbi:glycosyl hydrolase family 18 protein [Actinokineospora iranica]|uniref:Chitinase n=1 Tax=Actinokineospora iranica TaxID=1271860 RepID=A0A1G6X7I0_9PSEU|nr:glycosyl hydrolase family 18 protein [Actinokineospora iranica]SDD73813.1 Chitinase [Actinokineospora iranica]